MYAETNDKLLRFPRMRYSFGLNPAKIAVRLAGSCESPEPGTK